ncbi:MAG TPA: response regulator [Chthonomonadaceae bacterium]|nr:response regulator [Chthonomonadaceae bacterium]
MTPQTPPFVLIADADPYICRIFEARLTKGCVFDTVSAGSGQEAVRAAAQCPFSAILWDMRLQDSFALLPRIRALCPNAALVLLTTDDRPTLEPDIARLDVTDILVKPLNLDTLVERVDLAIRAPQAVLQRAPMEIARVGQRLELISALGTCVTRVLENRPDSFTVVGAPRVHVPADFRTGLRLRARIAGEDAVYSFIARILGEIDDPIAGWLVQKPRSIRREQRRRYPRQAISFAISLEPEGEPEASQAAGGSLRSGMPVRGRTEEFGMGGCSLVSDRPLPAGTPVCFVMTPPADAPITGLGAVVQATPCGPFAAAEPAAVFRLAVRFLSLSPSSRRRLRDLTEAGG